MYSIQGNRGIVHGGGGGEGEKSEGGGGRGGMHERVKQSEPRK